MILNIKKSSFFLEKVQRRKNCYPRTMSKLDGFKGAQNTAEPSKEKFTVITGSYCEWRDDENL